MRLLMKADMKGLWPSNEGYKRYKGYENKAHEKRHVIVDSFWTINWKAYILTMAYYNRFYFYVKYDSNDSNTRNFKW